METDEELEPVTQGTYETQQTTCSFYHEVRSSQEMRRHVSSNVQSDGPEGIFSFSDTPLREGDLEPEVSRVPRENKNNRGSTSTLVTRENVSKITKKHLRRRRRCQFDNFQDSLRTASNCLDCRKMIKHLEEIALKESANEENKIEESELLEQLEGYRKNLEQAVNKYDRFEIHSLQGSLEALILRYNPDYIERVQAEKVLFRKAVRENKPPHSPPTWNEDPAYRLLSLFRGDFSGQKRKVTAEELRWWVSRGAWVLAISLLLVAITFVSIDFYRSITNPALSTKVTQMERLSLPIVYACLTIPFVPTFLDIEKSSSFVGYPLWALRSYTNFENGETYVFPDTNDAVAESTFIGIEGYCNESMKHISKKKIEEASNIVNDVTRCYSCLRIGEKKPVWITYKNSHLRPSGAVTLEFALQKELGYCFKQGGMWDTFVRDGVKDELKKHSRRLNESGAILALNPSDDMNFILEHGFQAIEDLKDANRLNLAQASVYCNLYFLSGVFYPIEPGTQIRYSFNRSDGVNAWKMLEDESKYLKIPRNIQIGIDDAAGINETTFLDAMHNVSAMNFEIASKASVNIFSVEKSTSRPGVMDFSGVLRDGFSDTLLYTKTIEQGTTRFKSTVQLESQKQFLVMSPYDRLNVSLDFASFNVAVNVKVPTTTLAEFLTDVFEYVGLFTGICAYSLLVSPARIYLQRIQKYQDAENK